MSSFLRYHQLQPCPVHYFIRRPRHCNFFIVHHGKMYLLQMDRY
ncbi:unnamed protein product [Onchocerca flexuosa]|uniref:Uncharacterized protein n=1 Tax=Onchocerca flexuosa TaxID=387005 RepID=A0A183HUU1_9BILA|nr:unnamed protein product [Onchocerca flexuosa]